MTIAQAADSSVKAKGDVTRSTTVCFHCMEALPKYSKVFARVDDLDKPVCCHGCKEATEFINAKGLGDFYRHRARSGPADRFAEVLKRDESQSHIQSRFVDSDLLDYITTNDDGSRDIQVLLQGLYCSSCSWLIEKALRELDSDIQVRVELDAKRVNVTLPFETKIRLSEIFQLFEYLGYHATPITINSSFNQMDSLRKHEGRQFIKRIAVAGFGMMQVMTYAVALYLGEAQGMDEGLRRFLTLVSMLVATAVVYYSGKPFFENAVNDLKNRHFGMDVPIALAIAGAYFPSVYSTLTQTGEHVYFDSAVMFVFFLLIGRYVEMRARHRLSAAPEALMNLLPVVIEVERFDTNQVKKLSIKVQNVAVGDQMILRAGSIVPFDARVGGGDGFLDESLITGEVRGVKKAAGDLLVAGSKLVSGLLSVEATRTWPDSSIVKIERMLQATGSSETQSVDGLQRFSRVFVIAVLLLTLVATIFWSVYQPHRVFDVTLAMLIASCPCAFALAAPVSRTAAIHALRKVGILLSNAKALNVISQVSLWCFDKTGTLTKGKTSISHVETYTELNAQQCLELIACIEKHSQHALANAFASIDTELQATAVKEFPGEGITATVDSKVYHLGKWEWIERQLSSLSKPVIDSIYKHESEIVFASTEQHLATVFIGDELRDGAKQYVSDLSQNGKQTLILSGDRQSVVDAIAEKLGINEAFGDLLPQQKLSILRLKRAHSHKVAMVGDGVNDAPVLSQADLSVAMASGSELSQSQADVILLNGNLSQLNALERMAKLTQRVTRQNLGWALAYNALVLPLAASGNLTPWIAAIGMSTSSLLVVLNALRITKHGVAKAGFANAREW